jgi:N utilization substance protein B
MGTRRRAREAALKILYEMDLSGAGAAECIRAYWDCFDLEAEGDEYAEVLVHGIEAQRDEVDGAIREASTRWRLERMASVDRNVLRIGVYELQSCPDVPARVVIDEAIELAKRYGGEESPAFVNGILDRIARSARANSGEIEEDG